MKSGNYAMDNKSFIYKIKKFIFNIGQLSELTQINLRGAVSDYATLNW